MRSDGKGKKMQEREKLCLMLFDNSVDGIILIDPGGEKILSANPAACRMLGWAKEELTGKGIDVVFDMEDLQLSSLLDKSEHSQSARAQCTCRRKVGTVFPGEVIITFTADSNGEPRAITVIRDLTEYKIKEKDLQEAYNKIEKQSEELKKINRELSESEARLRFIIANSPDIIFEQDRDLRYIWIYNPAHPLSVPDVIGKTDADLVPPDQAQRLEEIKRQVLETGMREQALLQLSPGGEPRCFEAIYEPRYDAEGQITGVISYTRDVTKRKQAEEALQRSRDTLCAIIDTAPAAIVVAQADGEILLANANVQRILGGSVTGNAHGPAGGYKITMPDGTPVLQGELPLSLALKGQTVTDTELLITRDDGTRTVVLASATPLKKNHRKPWGAVAVIQDITERKQLEEQLHQRAEELEMIMEFAPVGIWVSHDPQSHNVTGNKMATELYEAEAGENISANFTNVRRFFHKGRELIADELPMEQASSRDVEILNTELDILLPSGKYRTMLGSASPLHDAEGHVRGSIGTFVDITERKQAETRLKETLDNLDNLVRERTIELEKAYNLLKESEKSLSEAQEMANVGNWSRDLVTNKLLWSDELYRIFGLKPQEFEVNYNMFLTYVHPDDRKYVDNTVKRAMNGNPFDIEYRIVRPDGEERIVHGHGEVIFNNKNNPIRIRGTIQDITERKRMGEQIRQRAEELEMVMNVVPVAIFIAHDPQGNNITGNRMANEYSESEAGKNVSANVIPGRQFFCNDRKLTAYELPLQKAALKDIDVRDAEIDFILPSGQRKVVLGSASPLHDIEGHVRGSVGAFIDITRRKEAEEALVKIEELRVKEIHHRIKNNLQVISSLLDLQAENFSNLETCSTPEVIEAFTESQNRIISMALIHEELYQGKGTDNLDFAVYIHRLSKELFSSYNTRNKDISLKVDLEQIYLGMDTAIPLGIIVNELVSNSFKHAFSDGNKWEIVIRLRKTKDLDISKSDSEPDSECNQKNFQYVLTVADNGSGIPEEIDFKDTDSLGFQLVNLLVEQIDGCVDVKSDHGTEFTIWFNDIESK